MANSRKTAVEILEKIEDGAYLNLLLKTALNDMSDVDKKFTSALVYTTLENVLRIDYIINRFVSGKKVHHYIRNVLRIGICQLMFFESVPSSAAVNECVKLVASSKKRELKGFCNAVLRNVSKSLGDIEYPDSEKNPVEYLSVMYSYPEWLVEMYIRDYGYEFTENMLSYHKSDAFTTVRPNLKKTDYDEFESELNRKQFYFEHGKYLREAYYVKNITAVEHLKFYKNGKLTVQGESSMLASTAVSPENGDRILDMCAAPGGKTAFIYEKADADFISWDLYENRVEVMKANLARMGVQSDCAVKDGTVFDEAYAEYFDKIILDAPCSALGLLYRKPDIKYNKSKDDITAIRDTQRSILENAAKYLKKGGILVYSTCTVNKRENDDNIDYFLNNHKEFYEDDLSRFMPESLHKQIRGGRLQLFPHINEIDGFFITRLVKKND